MITETKSRPIIFTGESVRQILAGEKAMTRRAIKPQPEPHPLQKGVYLRSCGRSKYYLNKQLTETFKREKSGNESLVSSIEKTIPIRKWLLDFSPFKLGDELWVKEAFAIGKPADGLFYRATPPTWDDEHLAPIWRSPLFMPRWASRLTLTITSVRAERLFSISEADARAEGCRDMAEFRERWKKINGKWEDCWVWAIGFCVKEKFPADLRVREFPKAEARV